MGGFINIYFIGLSCRRRWASFGEIVVGFNGGINLARLFSHLVTTIILPNNMDRCWQGR